MFSTEFKTEFQRDIKFSCFNFLEKFEERRFPVKRNEKIEVRVDQVLQGHGATDTRNIARRYFRGSIIFAQVLEIDTHLVKNTATTY